MSCQTQPLAAAAFSDDKRVVSLHRSVRFSSESRGSRTPNDSDKRENTGAISLTSLVAPPAAAACDDAMTKSAPPNTSFDVDDPPPPPACRFPKLEECAHFHYERVALGGISVALADDQSDHDQEGWVCLEVRSHVSSPAEASTSGVAGIDGEKPEAGGSDASWTLFRNAENFLRLDDLLHRCIYDRKVSCLPNLADKFTPELLADRWRYRQLVAAYVHHLSIIADDAVNCGPVLYWLQMDNKGHKLLVSREDSSSINTPAVAAAYSVRKYTSTARDEISFDVGDMISVIDMPGPSESVWWRGKRGFRVGFFPHACVAVIGDKVPRHLPQPPPIVHSVAVAPIAPVLRKHGKLISLFRSFILSRPPRRALRQRGILRPRVFGCDLGELLLHSGGAVPEVLSACAKAIEERGAVDGIYRLSGGAGLTQRLRAAFDAGAAPTLDAALLARDPHAVASLLKMYFRELPNPLCTYQLYEPLVQAVAGTGPGAAGGNAGAAGSNGGNGGATAGAMTSEETVAQRLRAVRAVLVKLPPPHYRTLAFLARHLLRVSLLHEQTGMTARNMAIVWAPNLLRCPRPQHALQGVAVQAVVTEFLICYAEELFAEDQSMETDADTGAQDQSEQVELRGMEASKRPKSLPVHPPTKLLSLEEARRRAPGASPQPLTALRPASHHTPNYIEVGSGPNNLPQYHTVIDLPTPGRARGKSTPGGWRRLFSRSSRDKPARPAPPAPLPPAATSEEAMDESVPGVRAARSYESLCEAEVAAAAPAPRPPAMHARSSSCDSYFEGWQQELLEMRLRLAPQEQRTDMFHEVMEDSTGSSPGESQACSVEPSPRKLSDVDPAPSDRPSLEEQLAGIGYIDVESPRVAPRPGKRVCKDHDSPTNSMSDFQAAVAAVKLRERGSPRKTKPSARYSGMHQPVTLTDDKLTAVNSRLSWHGREGHSTLIKIDWPVENTSPSNLTASTLNSGPITPVTPVYDILESDSEVSEANKQTIKVETKDCQNCDREKCLQCELKAADCDNLKIEDYTEQNIQDSLEHSPVHSTEISYQNLNRLSTSSNSEPNSDRKRDHSYENCEAMKLMTSSHESSSSYSNASFTKQSDDYECCRKRPNYINLQSSSTSKSSPGSPLKSPLKSTISITFRSPTKSTSEYDNIETPTNERDSLYEDIDLEKNLSIVEEAPVPEADASLPTQQACQPADFSQDLIILEPPNEDDVDVYSQVKFLRRSIQEVNAMILESPEKEEKEEVRSDNERNIYENVNFDEKSYENINVDALGVCDKHVELNAASVDNICEAVNNKVIENSSEPLANQNLEKDNGNVVKQKVVSTNLNVRELANRFESPTEQKPQFNFDKTRPEQKCNQEHKEEEKKCLEIVNKVQSEKPNSPKTYKLDKTSTNTRSLDENAFIKEFGSTTETDRRKSLEVKDFKKRAKYLPDLNLNLEETETKVESVTPTTENKISLIQRFNDMIKPDLKTLIDSDTEKKLSRERIEKYKEERRNFLREKYSSQSFRSNPEQLTRIKLKKDSTEAIDVDDKEELQKFERRNTVDSGQRLRFSLARSANNLDAIQSPLGTKQECFPISVADAGVAKELDRKDKPPTYHIRDMAAMFEQKSLNSP